MKKQYLSDRQVASRYDIGRSTVWWWVRKGLLPEPRKFGRGTTRWDSEELDKYDRKTQSAA